jgi:hypothetical protein
MARKLKNPRVVPEHKLYKVHTGHANHMCELVSKRKMNDVATLSKDAKYICHICGRAAAKASNLCEPVLI